MDQNVYNSTVDITQANKICLSSLSQILFKKC